MNKQKIYIQIQILFELTNISESLHFVQNAIWVFVSKHFW